MSLCFDVSLKVTFIHRCFSIMNRRQKNEGLVFREFETSSLQLQIPVVDLLENFKQLLGDAANTSKMTDREAREKMEWVKNAALLPFSKFCMWCLAMKQELVAAPQTMHEEFPFLDAQKNFLKTGCTCNQCQSGDAAQLIDKTSGSWSCIRNSRRGDVDIVVSFNLLEQQAAAGAALELTFCCMLGAAYNLQHEPNRLFRLLPTEPLDLKNLLSSISANSSFDSRLSLVRHWLVSHSITAEQLCALVDAGGSRRWKAELLVVAVNRLICPVAELSKCLSSIIANLPGSLGLVFLRFFHFS